MPKTSPAAKIDYTRERAISAMMPDIAVLGKTILIDGAPIFKCDEAIKTCVALKAALRNSISRHLDRTNGAG